MRIIGLTGPIGSGKNEVAKILRRLGAYIVDVDQLAHHLYRPQTLIWQQLVQTFGSKILMRGGRINRKKLGEVVFSDRKSLEKLNQIIHPYLREAIAAEINKPEVSSYKLVIVNAALPHLFQEIVGEVWLVIAGEKNRLARLREDGLSKKEASLRSGAQLPTKKYLVIADKIIKNDGTLSALKQTVARFYNALEKNKDKKKE